MTGITVRGALKNHFNSWVRREHVAFDCYIHTQRFKHIRKAALTEASSSEKWIETLLYKGPPCTASCSKEAGPAEA